MSRRRHLYRVTATWTHDPTTDGDRPADTVRHWHYQTKAAADHRAAVLRDGMPARPTPGAYDREDPGLPAQPPAIEVTVERSQPITWLPPTPTWRIVTDAEAAVDALRLIAGPAPHCSTSTTEVHACRQPTSGRTRGARHEADAWCDPCTAANALTQIGLPL